MSYAIGLENGNQLLDLNALKSAINDGLDNAVEAAIADKELHQQTWSSKSKSGHKVTRGNWFRGVEIDGKIFRYVDRGRKGRVIVAKKAKYLKFKSGYTRKTKRGAIPSGQGGSFGKDVFRKQVKQDPVQGSNFSQTIKTKYDKELSKIVQAAIDPITD